MLFPEHGPFATFAAVHSACPRVYSGRARHERIQLLLGSSTGSLDETICQPRLNPTIPYPDPTPAQKVQSIEHPVSFRSLPVMAAATDGSRLELTAVLRFPRHKRESSSEQDRLK